MTGIRGFYFILMLVLTAFVCDCSAEDSQKESDNHEKKTKAVESVRSGTIFEIGRRPEMKVGPQLTSSTFVIESGPISFSEVIPGHDKDLPGSIAIRVFSHTNWRLHVAVSSVQVFHHIEPVQVSGLKIRSRGTAGFTSFQDATPVLIAQGIATKPAGNLILADLRLRLADNDPTGVYSFQLRISLEVD